MAQITLTVNGRDYVIGCAAGQEQHLRAVAREVAERVDSLARSVGQVGEARLLLMAALLLADALAEARADVERTTAANAEIVEALTTRLDVLATRVEAL